MLDANFWQNKAKSQKIVKEKKLFEDLINSYNQSNKQLEDLNDLYELALEENNNDIQNEVNRNIKELRTLLDGTISFKNVMVNLEDVLKNYLGDDKPIFKNNNADNPYDVRPIKKKTKQFYSAYESVAFAGTKFKDGALYINVGNQGAQSEVREKHQNRYFMSWGFFEDIILNSFFEMKSGDKTIQQIRSVEMV